MRDPDKNNIAKRSTSALKGLHITARGKPLALNQPSALSAAEGDRRESNGEAPPWVSNHSQT